MKILNIVATTATALICIAALIKSFLPRKAAADSLERRTTDVIGGFADRWHWVIFALIMALSTFLRFYRLSEVPSGLNPDGTASAYEAWSLINYGVDRQLHRYPVYLINFGDGQSVMYSWLISLSFRLFGTVNAFSIRFPMAFFGVLSTAAVYSLCRTVISKRFALLGAMLTDLPAYFHSSSSVRA